MMWIYSFLVSFAAFAAIIITPAFPDIARYFNVSEHNAQFAMSGYLLGYTFGILFYGPIANRFGRKKTIFIGLSLSLVGTLICLFTPNFTIFVIGRVLQAFGASAGFKIVFTMIGDRYSGKEASKKVASVMFSFAIAPGIASVIGGHLTEYFDWHYCFVFLIFYTLFLALLARSLTETAAELDAHAFKWHRFSVGFGHQFKNSYLILNAILMGIGTSLIYIFAAEAPFIAIDVMGIRPDIYGLFSLIPPLGLGIGTIITRRFADHISAERIILLGIFTIFTSLFVMGQFFGRGILNGWVLFIPFGFIQIGNNLSYVSASSRALSHAKDKSYAASVMQFCNMLIATTLTWLAGTLIPKNPLTLTMAFTAIALAMLTLWYILKRRPIAA